MRNIDLKLPAALESYVEEQVHRRGYRDAGEFLTSLVEAERHRQLRAEIEATLAAAADGPFTDLTADDFEDVRREGLRIIQERQR